MAAKSTRAVVLAAGAVLLLGACSSGGSGSSGGDAASTSSATGFPSATPLPVRTPTPTPTPTPYGPVLTGWIAPLESAVGQLAKAGSMDEFSTALKDAGTKADNASTGLSLASEPAGVATARRQLMVALGQLAADLDKVRGDIRSKNLCATSSALAKVGESEGLAGVAPALKALADAGYPTSFNVPDMGKLQHRSLDNGTLVREGRLNGEGVLSIENGGSSDAVLSLAKGGKSVHSIFVSKGKTATLEGIEDGTYDIYFAGGADWDSSTKAFTQSCDFSKFDDTMEFETSRTYTKWSITLQPTVGGNAQTSDVPEGTYPLP
ncbi:hypothetical protein [Kitasatospora sp. NPDC050543]|uniref:hypothetical protein n=1 Tax=Kitasatospora sp. NPDC050543 TaxID=3364054 RepID=UPI0037AC7DBC